MTDAEIYEAQYPAAKPAPTDAEIHEAQYPTDTITDTIVGSANNPCDDPGCDGRGHNRHQDCDQCGEYQAHIDTPTCETCEPTR